MRYWLPFPFAICLPQPFAACDLVWQPHRGAGKTINPTNARLNESGPTATQVTQQLPTSALPWHAAAKQPTLDLVSACAALTPVIGAAQKNEHQREPAPSCADDGHGVLGAS